MTEEEKAAVEHNFGLVLEHVKEQLNVPGWQAAHDKIMLDLTSGPMKNFASDFISAPLKISEIIDQRQKQIDRLQRTIDYIKETDSSELTPEGIKNFSESLA